IGELGDRREAVVRLARRERIGDLDAAELGLAVVDEERRRGQRVLERLFARVGALVGGDDADDVVAVGDRLRVPFVLGARQRLGAADRLPVALALLAIGEAVDELVVVG